ncbi:hypothetical protein AbraIFM66950_007695 [Aspergillus brasiliensis]|nr:hypothetical protein AbraIFM66950_007695 [Aspergillus brasiliensis]
MSPFITDKHLPPISFPIRDEVTLEERTTAIEFVNCHNFIFEEFDHAKMIATFLPDAVIYHPHGSVRGLSEMKPFLENVYGFFIPGISHNATNHIVDRDVDGGLIVRYKETLIRYGWTGDDEAAFDRVEVPRTDGLPAIWWTGTVIDRLRMADDGWRVFERYVGRSFRNANLDAQNE